MATVGAPSGCRLTPTADPAVFKSTPGIVTLALNPTTGNVTFLVKETDVMDSSGKSVSPTKTATSIQFTVAAGQTYTVETEYFIFPTHSTGVLQESCSGGVVLSQVSIATNPQQFVIKG